MAKIEAVAPYASTFALKNMASDGNYESRESSWVILEKTHHRRKSSHAMSPTNTLLRAALSGKLCIQKFLVTFKAAKSAIMLPSLLAANIHIQNIGSWETYCSVSGISGTIANWLLAWK